MLVSIRLYFDFLWRISLIDLVDLGDMMYTHGLLVVVVDSNSDSGTALSFTRCIDKGNVHTRDKLPF